MITLLWDPGREADLAGYKVWRREAGRGEWTLSDRTLRSPGTPTPMPRPPRGSGTNTRSPPSTPRATRAPTAPRRPRSSRRRGHENRTVSDTTARSGSDCWRRIGSVPSGARSSKPSSSKTARSPSARRPCWLPSCPPRSSPSASITGTTPRSGTSPCPTSPCSSSSRPRPSSVRMTRSSIPEMSRRVDYEGELAFVVGRRASGLTEADRAEDYILGYTCFNDVTARDLQDKDKQFTRAKSFDTFAADRPLPRHRPRSLRPWPSRPSSTASSASRRIPRT